MAVQSPVEAINAWQPDLASRGWATARHERRTSLAQAIVSILRRTIPDASRVRLELDKGTTSADQVDPGRDLDGAESTTWSCGPRAGRSWRRAEDQPGVPGVQRQHVGIDRVADGAAEHAEHRRFD